jgi:endonuclease III
MKHLITARDLHINVNTEKGLFLWFLASFLFGKRIQEQVAQRTYEAFVKHHLTDPQRIHRKSWQQLVDILGEGHYRRYDESTARYLLDWSQQLIDEYGGRIKTVAKQSESRKDFCKRLECFKGVGPKTVEIFMREAGPALF